MNILLAMYWDHRVGGVTHVATALARTLEKAGHTATFLFPEEVHWKLQHGTSRHGFPSVQSRLRAFPPTHASWKARFSWYSTVLTTLPQLVRYARTRRIDLINLHYPGDEFALLADVAQRLHIPLVVSAHGSDLLMDAGPNRGEGVARLLAHADAVVVPSQDYRQNVVGDFPSLNPKMHCIYNGFDETEWLSRGVALRDPPGSGIVVLSIGKLISKKGIDVMLRAVSLSVTPGLTVRIVGEGSLRGELESLTASLGISDRVSFLGSKDRQGVFDELSRCDLVVMPSRHQSESFGLATLEAMAWGKPVIASAVGGLKELVDDGRTGRLVTPDDPSALARTLDELGGNSGLRTRMGEAGRLRAQRFTAAATGEAYEALFQRLIAGTSTGARP